MKKKQRRVPTESSIQRYSGIEAVVEEMDNGNGSGRMDEGYTSLSVLPMDREGRSRRDSFWPVVGRRGSLKLTKSTVYKR